MVGRPMRRSTSARPGWSKNSLSGCVHDQGAALEAGLAGRAKRMKAKNSGSWPWAPGKDDVAFGIGLAADHVGLPPRVRGRFYRPVRGPPAPRAARPPPRARSSAASRSRSAASGRRSLPGSVPAVGAGQADVDHRCPAPRPRLGDGPGSGFHLAVLAGDLLAVALPGDFRDRLAEDVAQKLLGAFLAGGADRRTGIPPG